jgi:hypothetical protein
VNDRQFRQHIAELLSGQRNPGAPTKKNSSPPELPPKPATMSNKEFRKHLKQLVARQGNEGQPPAVEKKPPKPEPPKPTVVTEKKPPTTETRKFNVWRKAK